MDEVQMLDAYIIESIRREQARKEESARQRIQLEIPLLPPKMPEIIGDRPDADEPDEDRGPIVIPLVPDVSEDAA